MSEFPLMPKRPKFVCNHH